VLDKLSASLCDAALGRKHSADELDAIRSSNLFLVPLDAHGEWYRYHHLFQDLLRRQLLETEPDLVPVVVRRAAEWFERHGDPEVRAPNMRSEINELEDAARISWSRASHLSQRSWRDGRDVARRFEQDAVLDRHPLWRWKARAFIPARILI
jgi:LuxR family maltose regulon positive regulatory protein